MNDSALVKLAGWFVTILTPIILVITVVRMLLTPGLLAWEYNTPGFPADPYGFTKEERLYWGRFAVDYLVNEAGIEYLGDLRFEDGSPVYNERELSHMLDVKLVVQATLRVWLVSLAGMLLLALWAWRGRWMGAFQAALLRGGWLTILLLGSVIAFVLVSFGVIFVAFHEVFFAPGTWLFFHTDTLIRLFPERFWRDMFIYVGGLSVLGALVLILALRRRRTV